VTSVYAPDKEREREERRRLNRERLAALQDSAALRDGLRRLLE
jgi:hypothetical protein